MFCGENILIITHFLSFNKKKSIEGIKKLLEYAPCWEITMCSDERKSKCSAYIDKTKPCWELNRMICNRENGKICEDCVVFISKKLKTKPS